MGIKKISSSIGLNYSTTHHLVSTLCEKGYLRQSKKTKKYYLGFKPLQLGLVSQESMQQIGKRVQPILDKLVEKVNEDSNLAILDGTEIVYIVKSPSSRSMRMFTRLGSRAPLYCTGVGKIFLASMDEPAAEKLFKNQDHVPKTCNTITKWEGMKKELEQIKESGYAFDNEEAEIDVMCIAVPVSNLNGELVFALSISGLASRLSDHKDEFIEELKKSADELSPLLGLYNLDYF